LQDDGSIKLHVRTSVSGRAAGVVARMRAVRASPSIGFMGIGAAVVVL
jgi:hypothetical protein